MGLYQKYRPRTFKEVIGQDAVVSSLQSVLSAEEFPHAFLFHGPAGCGKTTLGRILAQELGVGEADFKELDTADFRGIDSMRDIRRTVSYAPMEGKVRVWLLDECHQITGDGQDALLKALEDAPAHAFFILCTTDPQKLKKTVRSRCAEYEISALEPKHIGEILVRACKGEGVKPPMDVLKLIARECMGSARTALVALEQVLRMPEDQMLEAAKRSVETEAKTNALCQKLLKGAPWKDVAACLKDIPDDPERVRISVFNYMAAVLRGGNERAFSVMCRFETPYHYTPTASAMLARDCYDALTSGTGDEA